MQQYADRVAPQCRSHNSSNASGVALEQNMQDMMALTMRIVRGSCISQIVELEVFLS